MHIHTRIRQLIEQKTTADGVMPPVSQLARETGVSEQAVIECLAPDIITRVSPSHFRDIMVMLATWGKVEITIQNQALDLSILGSVPLGELTDEGEYRFVYGEQYPFGGSIRAELIASIFFLDYSPSARPVIVFFDYSGTSIFKISPQKDEQSGWNQEQAEYFTTLRDMVTSSPGCSCCS